MNSEHIEKLLQLAGENAISGRGGPFAAMVVRGDEIISTATNEVLSSCDPTAHAEVQAIRQACKNLESFQLDDCELYTSCEPCPMCLGAIYWARPERVIYVATRREAARGGFDDDLIYKEIGLPIEQRKIEFVQVQHERSFAPFETWLSNDNKMPY